MSPQFAPYELDLPQGPPRGTLICVPGLNSGAYLFTGAKAALPEWQIIRFATPGVPGVPLPIPFTVHAYAAHVAQALQQLQPFPAGPVVILGHSLGGYAVQCLLAEHDVRPSRVVLASTSRGQPDTAKDVARMERRLKQPFFSFFTKIELNPAEGMKPLFGPSWPDRDPHAYSLFLRARQETLPETGATLAQLAAGAAFSSVRWLRQLEVPTLVMHGTADLLVSAESGRKLAEHLPNGRWLPLHEVGHFPMLEHPNFWSWVADYAKGANLGSEVAPPPGVWQRVYDWWQRSG